MKRADDPLLLAMCAAWESLSEKLAREGEVIAAELGTEAAKSSAAAGESVAIQVGERTFRLAVAASLEASYRMHAMAHWGGVDRRVVAEVSQACEGFARAAVTGTRMTCTSAQCSHTEEAGSIGPAALCPQCGSSCVPVSHGLRLVGPNGQALG